MIERQYNLLKDLSYTYFTVEDINHEVIKVKEEKRAKEYYDVLELVDRENLKPLDIIIQ